jgi:methyl-accepting chemotaxis protein
MKRISLNSLKSKILLPLFIVSILICGIAIAFIAPTFQSNMSRLLQEKISSTEQFLVKVAPVYIQNYDFSSLSTFATEAASSEDIICIEFKDADGNLIAQSEKDGAIKQTNKTSHIIDTLDIKDDLDDVIGTVVLTYSTSKVDTAVHTIILTMVMFIIVCLPIALLAWYKFINYLVKPIKTLEKTCVTAASNTDLTLRIENLREDEVGRVGASLNGFFEKIAALLTDAKQTSVGVLQNSEEFNSNISIIKNHLTSQKSGANEISIAVQEASQTLTKLDESSQGVLSDLFTVVNKTDSANESMAELAENSNEINNFVSIINDIAEQINLLALNASIEAARAGAAGKGFAVVANEVKKLAEQTVESTASINKITRTLRENISGTQTEFTSVATAINEIEESMQGIANSVTRQSNTVEEINATMHEFSGQVESNSEIVTEVENSSNNLGMAVSGLIDEMDVFKLK